MSYACECEYNYIIGGGTRGTLGHMPHKINQRCSYRNLATKLVFHNRNVFLLVNCAPTTLNEFSCSCSYIANCWICSSILHYGKIFGKIIIYSTCCCIQTLHQYDDPAIILICTRCINPWTTGASVTPDWINICCSVVRIFAVL